MTIDERLSDGALLRRSAKGDEDAFRTLYARHQGGVYRFALRMMGNAWAAEEIVQEVFLTLIRDPKKYDEERGSFPSFLFGITRNRVLKHFDRAPRELELEDGSDESVTVIPALQDSRTPAHWAEQQERLERVRLAVSQLPPEFREAVVLCELEELSYEEAAERIGCPIGTVRSRLHRGRALLLAKLEMLREAPRRVSAAG
jgi:RNA polymerase sigma-70 factor, ECF subfamily